MSVGSCKSSLTEVFGEPMVLRVHEFRDYILHHTRTLDACGKTYESKKRSNEYYGLC